MYYCSAYLNNSLKHAREVEAELTYGNLGYEINGIFVSATLGGFSSACVIVMEEKQYYYY